MKFDLKTSNNNILSFWQKLIMKFCHKTFLFFITITIRRVMFEQTWQVFSTKIQVNKEYFYDKYFRYTVLTRCIFKMLSLWCNLIKMLISNFRNRLKSMKKVLRGVEIRPIRYWNRAFRITTRFTISFIWVSRRSI